MSACTYEYITEHRNLFITGATGSAKIYLAVALGMAANRSFYSVRYIRLPDLLVEISAARANGTYRDFMKKLKKENLLIGYSIPLKETESEMYWTGRAK